MASVKVQMSELFFQSQSRATASAMKLMSGAQAFGAATPTARCSGFQKTLKP